MFERRSGGQAERGLELLDELIAVEGVAQVDEARRAVDHGQGQPVQGREQLGGLLVGVHAVAKAQLGLAGRVLPTEVVRDRVVVLGRVGERLDRQGLPGRGIFFVRWIRSGVFFFSSNKFHVVTMFFR